MTITGAILIGSRDVQREARFRAIDAATGKQLPQTISESSADDAHEACALAEAAFARFSTLAPQARAAFLEAVADQIIAIGDVLIETAMAETGLPRARLEGERGRTAGQLRMFVAELRRGEWLDVSIDPAQPERTPLARADLRRMNVALGPVAVFGASNFPLAFSVAGGDTASALAAGCPVVVKGHPAHPATCELVARAVRAAVQACDLPEGVFSYLPGASHELGAALVGDPRIKAVGFTGSRAGGLALMAIAARREQPIPVHAEMSSINPVVLMPHALAARAGALATAFVNSMLLGAGQFCTNPGVVIAIDGPDLDRFIDAAAAALAQSEPQVMLSPGIHANYSASVALLDAHTAARRVAIGKAGTGNRCTSALFECDARSFLADPALAKEVFGASSLIVRCQDLDEVARVIERLEGQLTATLQFDPDDVTGAARLLPLLQAKAGRVLANGWPTGVEVTHAMVHGGPFPGLLGRANDFSGHIGDGALSQACVLSGLARRTAAAGTADEESLAASAHGERKAGDAGMIRSLLQFERDGARGVAALDDSGAARVVGAFRSTRAMALAALAADKSLAALAHERAGDPLDLASVTLLCPIDHDDAAHLLVSGTGLTHLGSAEGRDKMHKAASSGAHLTDSMRMFLMGEEGGKPAPGTAGVQPEWFYKGDGSILVAPGLPFEMPSFAEDGGEEPEIAGIYLIGANGEPARMGFALGNEFSDHVVERHNYLWLAHSKLRQAALGPELLLGDLPASVRGTSRILRNGATLWEKPFLSGEANMSHSIANLEHHHFKYALFRRSGDVHVHFFGTATLSFSDGVKTQVGDVFEVEADAFSLPVRNPLARRADAEPVKVRSL